MRPAHLALLALATAVACGEGPDTFDFKPPAPSSNVRIDAVSPSRASVEGGDAASIFGARFCTSPLLSVDGVDTDVSVESSEELRFVVPPARNFDVPSQVEVAVLCGGTVSATGVLDYDPTLVVKPEIVAYGPVGDNARPDAGIWVQFNRQMDPQSLHARVGIEGIPGKTIWDRRNFVAAFVPDEPLKPGVRVVTFVRGGENGVRSSFGGTLPHTFSWRYTTCKSCGSPLP